MPYEVAKVNQTLCAVAVFDDSWGSYNNVYALQEENEVILIDSGKAEHAHTLVKGLTQLDIRPKNVSTILLTHGHNDHVGGLSAFATAKVFVHPLDKTWAKEHASVEVNDLSDNLPHGFTALHVGSHSKGSVVYYHSTTKALFSGDFLTFFTEPIVRGHLVTEGLELRKKSKDILQRWLNSPAVKARSNPEGFRLNLQQMASFDAEYFCTGHGPVLRGDISTFLRELSEL